MNALYEFQIIGTYLAGMGLETVDLLSSEDFIYCPRTFTAIKRAVDKREEINPVNIANDSEFAFLELIGFMREAFPAQLESNIEGLKKARSAQRLQEILKEPLGKDVYENITDLVEKLQNIDLYRSKKAVETKDACVTYMNELDERRNERNREMKIGIDKFDKTTGGFHRKELTVIGARPSVGKSALALQIACELACQKFKVLFVSLEMSEMQILERMVAKYSRVEHEKLREGNLEKKDMDRLSIGTNEIARRNFTLTTSIRTIGELRAQAVLSRPDIIILDYVGLLKDTSENWRDKRTEISSITRKLKLMTLDLNLPIVILAQLSRSAQNKEPILSELRDSGSLEEDADNVLFVHRLSAIEAESKGFGSLHQCEYLIRSGKYPTLINIEKHRNGATGYIRTLFHSNRFTFEQTKDEKRIG